MARVVGRITTPPLDVEPLRLFTWELGWMEPLVLVFVTAENLSRLH